MLCACQQWIYVIFFFDWYVYHSDGYKEKADVFQECDLSELKRGEREEKKLCDVEEEEKMKIAKERTRKRQRNNNSKLRSHSTYFKCTLERKWEKRNNSFYVAHRNVFC